MLHVGLGKSCSSTSFFLAQSGVWCRGHSICAASLTGFARGGGGPEFTGYTDGQNPR